MYQRLVQSMNNAVYERVISIGKRLYLPRSAAEKHGMAGFLLRQYPNCRPDHHHTYDLGRALECGQSRRVVNTDNL
jgi:hypothetical protein